MSVDSTAPPVAVWVPREVWGRLASVADDRGATIEDLLVLAIESITDAKHSPEQKERVIAMVVSGYADAAIAEELGMLLQRVAVIRRKARLRPNTLGRGGGGIRRAS